MPDANRRRRTIGTAGRLTLFSLYLYVFLEWLFFATKPSFLSSYTVVEQVGALGAGPLFFLPAVLVSFGLSVAAYLLLARLPQLNRSAVLAMVPAAVATVVTVLLIDNFTYTVFALGIVRTPAHLPNLLLVGVVAIWLAWCFWFSSKINRDNDMVRVRWAAPGLLLFSLASCVAVIAFAEGFDEVADVQTTERRLPNIVMFAADGIQASNVSTYGYHRQTTPHLDRLAKEALVVNNALANAGRTTGSVASMLSGKYPTTTKVLYPPHVLRGRHSYQHLPAVLKTLGYVNFQESIVYYADGHDLNMQSGFDIANGRAIDDDSPWLPQQIRYKIFPLQRFAQRLWERVKNRALHLVGYRPMYNAFDIVNGAEIPPVYEFTDAGRIARAIEFIESTNRPFFMHIHLLGPHCCEHFPESRKFSATHAAQNNDNAVDFYDDTIVDSDFHFGELIEALRENDKFDDTLIVYSSDHTRGWRTTQSVPLVIRFPGGEHAGVRDGLAELVDVAPTVIDHLGLPRVEWMEGRSLLEDVPSSQKMAFMVDALNRKRVDTSSQSLSQLVGGGPPLYGMHTMVLLHCDRSFLLDVADDTLISQPFNARGQMCVSDLDDARAKALLKSHLTERGFALP